MPLILVTGGCGYIGAHTIIDLVENGFDVISVDDHSRSDETMLARIKNVCGREIRNYKTDLCDFEELRKMFSENRFDGIIHFAAYKAVNESVVDPLLYYSNNISSLVNILRCAEEFSVHNFIFSSSCSVYGNVEVIPVTEDSILSKAESPYGRTKQIGEEIIRDLAAVSLSKFILLRYFNPAGAHPSGLIGEMPYGKPTNLVPVITQSAAGILPVLNVFGTDYPTRDGSCVRDFVHVCDIAHAHTLAIQYLLENKNKENFEIYNLGTGNGVTVLETIKAFENVSGQKLSVNYAERRQGDVVAIYANNEKARHTLNWEPQYDLASIMQTAWNWQLQLKETGVAEKWKYQ